MGSRNRPGVVARPVLLAAASDPFELISRSCAHAVSGSTDVQIDMDGICKFASRLDPAVVRGTMSKSSAISENANTIDHFPSLKDHVNYCILFSLMQFGHGFRHALHAAMDMGASKAMTSGVNRVASSGDMSARHLAAFSAADVDAHFRFPRTRDLEPLKEQVLDVLSGTGKALLDLGHPDFYSLVVHAIDDPKNSRDPLASMVRCLVNNIPAFQDIGTSFDGKPVYLFKKAQLAMGELHRTVGVSEKQFNFPDIKRVRAVVDNVIPAMLVKHGVLRLSDRLASIIRSRAFLPRGAMESELRAASVIACERIVDASNDVFTNVELGTYLWLLGKVGDNRQWERHHTVNTIFY